MDAIRANGTRPVKVLFVCMGNICRSPTAHGVFEALVAREGLGESVVVKSAGTIGHHEGEPPDRRTQEAARRRGYDLSHLRARRLSADDVAWADYVLVMDRDNLRETRRVSPAADAEKVRLFLDFAKEAGTREVPDPYYGGAQGFEHVLDLVEAASAGLIEEIRRVRLARAG